jgi:hypothetical protein
MLVNVGVGGVAAVTVNVTELLTPPCVVTVTFRAPVAAFAAMAKVAVAVVELVTCMLLTLTPVPPTVIADKPPSRAVPVNVTGVEVPAGPLAGLMLVNVGVSGVAAVTVNVSALLTPPCVVTVTFRAPVAAFAAMAKVAVAVVEFETCMLLTLTPVPLTVIADKPPSRDVPVNVTGVELPAGPLAG